MKKLLLILAATAALGWGQGVPGAKGLGGGPGLAGVAPLQYANVELTVYLVSGLAQPQPGAATDLPDDLAPTLAQMRGVFAYKAYKLINAFTLRGRNNGGAESAGNIPINNWHYDFRYRSAQLLESTPGVVHLYGLRLEITRGGSLRILSNSKTGIGTTASPHSDEVALVSTDLDLKEGQKAVVGQSAVNGTDGLFLIIVPKIIE